MPRKVISRRRWEAIQEGERTYHEQKDPSRILEIGLRYWRSILALIPHETGIAACARALDLGCGGCGILLALPEGRHTGVDPLMDFYTEKFPFLKSRRDIAWVMGTAEEFSAEEPYETVFLINCLDHTFAPDRVIEKALASVAPGGHVVILLNCHNTRFFRWYYGVFHRFIDRHHPFHFTPDDVVARLAGATLLMAEDIDAVWLANKREYERCVLKKKPLDPARFLRKALNPFKYPLAVSRFLLRRPVKKRRPGDRSIFSIYLFVFRKNA